MKLLNLACNGHRPPEPFINIDILRTQLHLGTPERHNLDQETNYIEHNLVNGIPFEDNSCDGIFASHFIEHLDAQESVSLFRECYRVLVPGGILVVSVPDATYFRSVYDKDNVENSIDLFGEPIHCWNVNGEIVGPFNKFFDYALFHHEHKQILTEDGLWALMVKGGFANASTSFDSERAEFPILKDALNRSKFSLVMWGTKL